MVTTTFCTSGMVLAKAGVGYHTNLDGKSAAILGSDFIIDLWIQEAENFIVDTCRFDFVSNFSSLASNKKYLLQELASSYAAMYAIQYDFTGFSSRAAAEDKINVLNNAVLRGLKLLEEDKTKSFMGAT